MTNTPETEHPIDPELGKALSIFDRLVSGEQIDTAALRRDMPGLMQRFKQFNLLTLEVDFLRGIVDRKVHSLLSDIESGISEQMHVVEAVNFYDLEWFKSVEVSNLGKGQLAALLLKLARQYDLGYEPKLWVGLSNGEPQALISATNQP